jgi:uncharacterized membrane protein (DUF4010 family)
MNIEATRMDREMIDIYSGYLITNFGQATTSLSSVLNGELSHDSITRSLADRELTSKTTGNSSNRSSEKSRTKMPA